MSPFRILLTKEAAQTQLLVMDVVKQVIGASMENLVDIRAKAKGT